MAKFLAFSADSKGKVFLETSSIFGEAETPSEAVAELYSQLTEEPVNVLILDRETYLNKDLLNK